MKNIKNLLDKANSLKLQAIAYEESYRGKSKGEIYQHGVKYLTEKMEHIASSLEGIGLGTVHKYKVVLAKNLGDSREISTILIWYSGEIDIETVKTLVLFKTKFDYIMDIRVVEQYITGVIIQEK